MVAPRPQEPLVLYLAATPYSASAAPVEVREEHRTKAMAATRVKAKQDQKGLTKITTTTEEDQPPQGNAPGAGEALPPGNQLPEAPSPQQAPWPPEGATSTGAPNLVEHPV